MADGARILIEVRLDGLVDIQVQWGDRRDAVYAAMSVQQALARALPQAFAEAQEYLREGVKPWLKAPGAWCDLIGAAEELPAPEKQPPPPGHPFADRVASVAAP